MKAHHILDRLVRVRETAPHRWIASCPTANHARGDHNPSLHIRETENGKVLLHCFAGCEVADIVSAVGLTLEDLFPDAIEGHADHNAKKPHMDYRSAFLSLEERFLALACAFWDIRNGKEVAPEDLEYLGCLCKDYADEIREVSGLQKI